MQENADQAESHTHIVPATQEDIRVMAVDEKYRNPKLMDARWTMATKLGGEHVGSLIFRIIKKTHVCYTLLFASSVVIGLLCYLGVLPSEIGWFIM